jgi:hypothetical protein
MELVHTEDDDNESHSRWIQGPLKRALGISKLDHMLQHLIFNDFFYLRLSEGNCQELKQIQHQVMG